MNHIKHYRCDACLANNEPCVKSILYCLDDVRYCDQDGTLSANWYEVENAGSEREVGEIDKGPGRALADNPALERTNGYLLREQRSILEAPFWDREKTERDGR